ncbi:Serine/threonine protein phosphatase [Winogradskyella psychrotolerans RS-3]|uniref:Serine/threonine protein phosphatase n=1 Tax=Winogradskyella psychrotolerans RS-3 TaxID=641526 RepID=S7VUA0_9FLAO|nr:metallophosphoesterase family protein [Winogradskyella psychrotolerans]EPR73855.1 Serine/threonine protein phosphatase [Winogradskyella psychrotolerans RS-3]
MRTLAIGDIHGGLRGLTQIIDRANVNSEDSLIFLGDYVDGWSESAQVIQYLIELSKTNTCVFIKGNHDVWCEQWLASGIINDVWFEHGGKETIESYDAFSKDQKLMHLHFFEVMPLYHLDAENRLFVHAGFTSMKGVESELHKENFYFDRTLWEMALTMDKNIDQSSVLYPNRLKHYSEIYIGHTPTINFSEDQPMNCGNVWNVDTGATFTGKLSAIDIDTKEVFQSNRVMGLYPDELGRNKK